MDKLNPDPRIGIVFYQNLKSRMASVPTNLQLTILTFGITRDIIGASEFQLQLPAPANVDSLQQHLRSTYPALDDLRSLRVAVNGAYATPQQALQQADEIALIPPVSGG